jgi:hypothetical protein
MEDSTEKYLNYKNHSLLLDVIDIGWESKFVGASGRDLFMKDSDCFIYCWSSSWEIELDCFDQIVRVKDKEINTIPVVLALSIEESGHINMDAFEKIERMAKQRDIPILTYKARSRHTQNNDYLCPADNEEVNTIFNTILDVYFCKNSDKFKAKPIPLYPLSSIYPKEFTQNKQEVIHLSSFNLEKPDKPLKPLETSEQLNQSKDTIIDSSSGSHELQGLVTSVTLASSTTATTFFNSMNLLPNKPKITTDNTALQELEELFKDTGESTSNTNNNGMSHN